MLVAIEQKSGWVSSDPYTSAQLRELVRRIGCIWGQCGRGVSILTAGVRSRRGGHLVVGGGEGGGGGGGGGEVRVGDHPLDACRFEECATAVAAVGWRDGPV